MVGETELSLSPPGVAVHLQPSAVAALTCAFLGDILQGFYGRIFERSIGLCGHRTRQAMIRALSYGAAAAATPLTPL